MPRITLLILLGVVLGTCGWIVAADAQGEQVARPLDLPLGGAGNDDDEEDEPETIQFYGAEYEGDAFFWCLDRSCSMGWGSSLSTLKQEMTEAVNSLTKRSEFGMVAFHTSVFIWQPLPVKANIANKSAAVAWIQAMTPDGATCLAQAGVAAVNLSNQCSKRHKSVIIVGDGVPECPPPYTPEQGSQVLENITGANYQGTPIHTIFISASETGVQLMQQLAAMNRGTFTHIQ